MKKILMAIFAVTIAGATFAQSEYEERHAPPQESTNGFKKQNLFLGGNFGLGIGSYTNINISPQIGYHVTPMFDLGAGINFQYVSEKFYDYYGNVDYKISQLVAGGNIFARFFPFPQGFLQVQPEYNNVSVRTTFYDGTPSQKANIGVPSLLVGAGANLDGLLIGLFYDAGQDRHSPYGTQPFLSFGYVVNLGGR